MKLSLLAALPLGLSALLGGCFSSPGQAQPGQAHEAHAVDPPLTDDLPEAIEGSGFPEVGESVVLTNNMWAERLTDEEFRVLRRQGTERPFTSPYNDYHGDGVFHCAGCGAPLYDSAAKFDSGTGWPSFSAAVEDGRVDEIADYSHGMARVEIVCASCGGHLGHVFPDGPPPTGQRHCVNGVSLDFAPR